MRYTLELQNVMTDGNYLIALRDNFEDLLAKSVLNIIQTKISNEEIEVTIKNKIFGVVVECVQNICSSGNQHASKKDSVLLMSKVENGYKIEVATVLNRDKEERFTNLLRSIEGKSPEELKNERNSILAKRTDLSIEEKEFLSIADISIRSAGNMNYRIESDENSVFMIIEIRILNN